MSPLALLLPSALAIPADLTAALPAPTGLVEVKGPERKALLAEDIARHAEGPGPVRMAVGRPISGDLGTLGSWSTLPDGRRAWQAVFRAATAEHLSLGFQEAALPEGAELWLAATDGRHALARPLTHDDARHGELWTPIVQGDELRAVLVLPAGTHAHLGAANVYAGYRPIGAPPPQGSCNIDVVCPEAEGWEEEIQAAAVYGMGGEFWCSGSMLSNTAGDQRPLFSTADHCGVRSSNAASLVVYWNYQSAACGDLSGGRADDWQTGATLRARVSDADWTLVELDDAPDPEWNVSWAGWDRRDQATRSAVAIHHPGTDEKAISFEDDPTRITDAYEDGSDPNGTHIRVLDWDLGTTEGGSSGSPLFSEDHRVVGVLTGGDAACGNDESDWYGRLAYAWDAGSSSSRRLSDWLDPAGTGDETVDTLAPWATGVAVRPSTGLSAEGPEGGPFSPASTVVEASNRDAEARAVGAVSDADWVGLVPAAVDVAPGETERLNLVIGDAAGDLPAGVHTASVTVSWDGPDGGAVVLPVSLLVGERTRRYFFPLDNNPGWDTEGDWEWGVPEGRGGSEGDPDPTSGYTGDHVYGYNLAGDYDDRTRAKHLTTRPLDMTNLVGTTLRFQRWLGVEEGEYDNASIEVSTDGDTWSTVWQNTGEVDDGRWVEQEVDVSALDGAAEAWIRWTMGSTDDSVRYCGWNIDDIEILGVQVGEWEPEPYDTGDPGADSGDPDTDVPDEDDDGPGGGDSGDSGAADGGDEDDDDISACGCAAGPGGAAGLGVLLLPLVLAARRRR
jgi:hypothetical protein